MYLEKVAEYKSLIYANEQIEKEAVVGAVAGLFRAFAPKLAPIGQKIVAGGSKALTGAVKGYHSFASKGVGGKALMGAKVGAGLGAVKGGLNYDSATDDGSFGSSRIGQVAKGIIGGAATGAATGGAIGVAAKGLKPIGKVPNVPPAAPVGGAQTVGGATGATGVPKPPATTKAPEVSQSVPKAEPVGNKVNMNKTDPITGESQPASKSNVVNWKDHSSYPKAKVKSNTVSNPQTTGKKVVSWKDHSSFPKAADYIDNLYMEKISMNRGV